MPAGALTFVDPLGRRMPEVLLPPPKTDPNEVRREHVQRGVTITAETIHRSWYAGDRLDLHHAVDRSGTWTRPLTTDPERRHGTLSQGRDIIGGWPNSSAGTVTIWS